MKGKLLSILIAVLLLTIAFSGCVKENTVTAEEIKERFLQAMENVTSYKYSAEGTYRKMTIKESTNTTENFAAVNGEIDILNKRIRTYNNGTSDLGREYFIFYFVDNMSYFGNQTNGNWTWTNWSSHFGFQQVWYQISYLELFSKILKNETGWFNYNNVELRRLSDEKVDGVDCYVLQLIGFTNQSVNYSTMSGYIYRENNIKYCVAKDTNLLKKSYFDTTSDENMINSFGNVSRYIYTIDDEMLFYDYNVSLDIELPPEAKKQPSLDS